MTGAVSSSDEAFSVFARWQGRSHGSVPSLKMCRLVSGVNTVKHGVWSVCEFAEPRRCCAALQRLGGVSKFTGGRRGLVLG